MWYFCLFEISFPLLLWRDVSYPLRLCCSAARSLKCFLFSFPSGINSPIFSAHRHFIPILSLHRHCLPIRFSVFLPSLPNCDLRWRVCTWLTSGLPQPVLWVLQVTPWIGLNGWLPRSLFLHLHFEKDLPVMSAQKSCRESSIPGPSLCPLLLLQLLKKVGLWSLRLISRLSPQE